MGALRWMPVHSILMKYNLTSDQREQLEAARKNPAGWTGVAGQGRAICVMIMVI